MNRAKHDIQRWSTSDVDEPQRLDYYAEAISAAIDPMRVLRRVEGKFDAWIDCIELGPLSLIHGIGQAHDCIRDRTDVARSTGRNFHLILNNGSAWKVRHVGEHLVRKGDAMLLDSRDGYRLDFMSAIDNVHLKLSEDWLKQWVADPAAIVGTPILSDGDWGGALTAFMSQLSPELVASAPLPQQVFADQIGALLALYSNALTGKAAAANPRSRDLRDRIQEILAQRCNELSLTAVDVAASLAISPRTLHRGLAAHQQTFGALLMKARVDLATRMLESPLFRRLTTAEIGRRAGFADPSHFARVYRRHSGFTPAQVQGGHA